jgi:hypothetical protein
MHLKSLSVVFGYHGLINSLLDSIKFQKAFKDGILAQGIPVTSPHFSPRGYQIEVGIPSHKIAFEPGPMSREEERPLSPRGTPFEWGLAAKHLSPKIDPSSSMEATEVITFR